MRHYENDIKYKKRTPYFEFVYENCTPNMTNTDIDSLTYRYVNGKHYYRFVEYKQYNEDFKGLQEHIFKSLTTLCELMNKNQTTEIWEVIIFKGNINKFGYCEIFNLNKNENKFINNKSKLILYLQFEMEWEDL